MDDIRLFETEGRMRYNDVIREVDALRLSRDRYGDNISKIYRLIDSLIGRLGRSRKVQSQKITRMAKYDETHMGYGNGLRPLRKSVRHT